jgi:hypothetical protein
MDKVGQAVMSLYGQLKVHLVETDDDDVEEEERAGWADTHCPLLARAFYIHMDKFTAEPLVIATVARVGEALQNIQWIWEKRKTMARTKVKSLQEMMQATVGSLKDALEGQIREDY